MQVFVASVMIGCAIATTALSQTSGPSSGFPAKPIAWDVISVKPNHSADLSGGMRVLPDGFELRNMAVRSLFLNAFAIRSVDQLIGAPDWIDSERYDVQAKMDAETAQAFRALRGEESTKQWQALCREILEERFALKYHQEKRELPVYDLVIAKQGLKMKESAPDEKSASSFGRGRLTANKGHVTNLVYGLSGIVGRLIVDKTGLTGQYDIELTWSNDDESDAGPSVFTALQEQLGLRLEPAKAQVDVVVIDYLERPSAN